MKARTDLLLAGLIAASSGHAQSPPNIVTEQVVVTATRFADSYIDKPASVTVISQEEIQRSPARTVPELLSYHTGLGGRDLFGNNGAQATVDMRGFGATAGQNTLILIDGRRLNDIDISGVQWSSLPLDSIERIEILRGGGGVLYGDGAVSGVINIITRKPGKDGTQATLTLGAGSLDTLTARADGEIEGESAGLRLGASYLDSQGYRENNRNIQSTAYAETNWTTDAGEVSLRFSGANQNLRLPGARTVQPSAGIDQLATDRRGTSTPKDYALRDDALLQFDWLRGEDVLSAIVGLSYRQKNQKSYFDFGGFPDYREIDLEVLALTPRLRFDHSGYALPGSLVVGFDWYLWNYRLDLTGSPATIGQPVHRVTADQENRALYVQETLSFGSGTTITGGARLEWLHIDASDSFDPTAPNPSFLPGGSSSGEQNEREHALEIGLRQTLGERWSGFGRASRAFRFATVDEIYESSTAFDQEFQFLRPQSSETYELGADWRAGDMRARAGVFRIDLKDEIHLDPFTSGVGNTNLPPSRRHGLELEFGKRPAQAIDITLAYTYTRAKFLEGVLPGGPFTPTNISIAGKNVPLVPRHRLSLTAGFAFSERLRMDAVSSYVGSQYMENDEENSFETKIPGYSVTDLRIAYQSGQFELGFAVSNLFDREYYNYAVRSQFVADRYNAYPLPGRTAFASLKVRLD